MAVTKHGKFGTRVYKIWGCMLYRRGNAKSSSWPHYGGRGVKVCPRWRKFENFYADMGEPPPSMSMDRIDPTGDYEPGNCRWASPTTQANNKRNSRKIEARGETLTITQWSKRLEIGATTPRQPEALAPLR